VHLLTLHLCHPELAKIKLQSSFIKTNEWLPNLPNPLDCHVWGNAGSLPLAAAKAKTIVKLKDALQRICLDYIVMEIQLLKV